MNDTTSAGHQRKHLVLHVEIPGFYADDLDDLAAIFSGPEPPGPRERLDVVLEEWLRGDVGITLVGLPGDKCMSDDFDIRTYTGRIVGAETLDVKPASRRRSSR
jgi:hypothetical protein